MCSNNVTVVHYYESKPGPPKRGWSKRVATRGDLGASSLHCIMATSSHSTTLLIISSSVLAWSSQVKLSPWTPLDSLELQWWNYIRVSLDCLTQKWNCVNLQIRTRLGINLFDFNFDNNSWSDAEQTTEQRFSPFPTHGTKYLLLALS